MLCDAGGECMLASLKSTGGLLCPHFKAASRKALAIANASGKGYAVSSAVANLTFPSRPQGLCRCLAESPGRLLIWLKRMYRWTTGSSI